MEKSALILGATSDIGYAIAKKFAAEGYAIILAARNPSDLENAKADITNRFNVACDVVRFDAEEIEQHQQFVNDLPYLPEVAVYSVGYMHQDNEVASNDPKIMQQTFVANYTGAASILNHISAKYFQNKKGTIIGISSVAGNRGRQSNYVYGSAKAAFTAYLSGLRNKGYANGVHVMTVLPGFVKTKMTEHLNLPPALTASPEQVANAVYKAFLKKRNVIYVKWPWRYIMKIITNIPESIFKKRKL